MLDAIVFSLVAGSTELGVTKKLFGLLLFSHRSSLVGADACVQVHAASLAREIRRKRSHLRMQAGTLLLHRVS